jgi:hypothetical protein
MQVAGHLLHLAERRRKATGSGKTCRPTTLELDPMGLS